MPAAALELLGATSNRSIVHRYRLPGEMDGVKLVREAQRRHPGLRVRCSPGYTEHPLIVMVSLPRMWKFHKPIAKRRQKLHTARLRRKVPGTLD